jgi:Concanavalin A-like lectin/glucanases superfamily
MGATAREFESANVEYMTYSLTPAVVAVPFTFAIKLLINTHQNQRFARMDYAADPNYFFEILQAGVGGSYALRVQQGLGGGSPAAASSSIAEPSVGSWHDAVGVCTSNASRLIYVDGTAGTPNTTDFGTPSHAPDRLAIAAVPGGTTTTDGALADFALWNVAFTQTDVDAFHAGTAPTSIQAANLKQWCQILGNDSPEPDEVTVGTYAITGTASQVAGPDAGSGGGIVGALAGEGGLIGRKGRLAGIGGTLVGFSRVGRLFHRDPKIIKPRLIVPVGISLQGA